MKRVIGQLDKPCTSIVAEEPSPIAFFRAAYQAFQRAEQAAGDPIERFYSIGGYIVRLRFAGPVLVPLITPALAHLATEPVSRPALTVCLWDSASTNASLPPPPWRLGDYLARGEIRGLSSGRFRAAFNLGSGVLRMLDAERNVALWWIRDACLLPSHEIGSPLSAILYWWMSLRGRQYVHAGAVGTPTGGVLLAGKGGCGKSTAALACLDSELVYVGDDYCLLATEPAPYAYSLYSSGKLDGEHIRRFPFLVPVISNANHLDSEKVLLFLHQHFPGKLSSGFPIRAILLPRITGRPGTTLTPTSPMIGLKALAPSTIFQLSGAGGAVFQTLARFVGLVPCYYLNLGTDPTKIPHMISALLSED